MNAARPSSESPGLDGNSPKESSRFSPMNNASHHEHTKDLSKQYAPKIRDIPAQITKDVLLGTLAASFFGYGIEDTERALHELGLDAHPARRKLTMWLEKDFFQPSAQPKPALHPAGGADQTRPDGGQAITKPDGLQELPDNIVLATLVARRNVMRLAPEQVVDYLLREVVPAMQRFYSEGETRERLIDLFVVPVKGNNALKWTKDRIKALLRLATYLENLPESDRTSGYYTTYGQLATLLNGQASLTHVAAIAAIYHRILIHPPSTVGVGLMAAAATNLSMNISHALDNVFAYSEKKPSEKTLQALNRIHTLAAVCAAKDREGDVSANSEKLKRLPSALAKIPGLYLPDDTKAAMALWETMISNLDAWCCLYPNFFGQKIPKRLDDHALCPLAIAGALARLELVDENERYKIGNAFANLVTLVDRGGIDKDRSMATIAAACLAAVGLWQVAVLGKNYSEILEGYHGLNICELLLRLLSDMSQEKLSKLSGLPHVLAWLANAGRWMEMDVLRMIESNFKPLLSQRNVPRSHEELVMALSKLTQSLLHELAGNNVTPPTLDVSNAPASTASVAVFVLQKIIGGGKFKKYVSDLNNITERLLDEAKNIDTAWQTLYGPETRLPGEEEASLRPGLVGPLAALEYAPGKKIISEKDWNSFLRIITQRSEVDPIQAVKDILSEDGSADSYPVEPSSKARDVA